MLVWIVFAASLFLVLLFRHPHLFQDVQFVLNKLKLRRSVQKYNRTNYFILDRFLDLVKAQPHKPFILFKDETYTYQDADELSNKAARVFLQSGRVKEGDTVALFVANEPTFLWLWLGLVKVGCSAAFLNYNIRSRSLLHCFSCSGAQTLVVAEGLHFKSALMQCEQTSQNRKYCASVLQILLRKVNAAVEYRFNHFYSKTVQR